jgi:hypothetical protein
MLVAAAALGPQALRGGMSDFLYLLFPLREMVFDGIDDIDITSPATPMTTDTIKELIRRLAPNWKNMGAYHIKLLMFPFSFLD